MRYLLAFMACGLLVSGLYAQAPTFSEDVAPIIYDNCTGCHRPGDIAPFTLLGYDDAYLWRYSISAAVQSRLMPPWPPDIEYNEFHAERILTQAQINTIVNWVDAGAPEGDPNKAPDVPIFPKGKRIAAEPDMTLTIPVYESQAGNIDEYACFTLPTGLTEDKYLRAVEIVPGNLEIVHHVIVFSSNTNTNNCNGAIINGKTITGYAPGAPPTIFPSGNGLKLGMKLNAGSYILIQLHYPEGTLGELDSTSVNLYFYDDTTGIREMISGPYVMNWLLDIPPDTVMDYEAHYPYLGGKTDADMSILAVFPHMHKIGTKMKSYAVAPGYDTIPLVNVPHWDFEWQGFYNYNNLVKIPKGSKMLGFATYDNTTNNHHNPFNPPQRIQAGEATTDEMFLISFQSMAYKAGDENIDLTDLLSVPTSEPPIIQTDISVAASPNPTAGLFTITGWNEQMPNGTTQMLVQDVTGKVVAVKEFATGKEPIRVDLGKYEDGVYLVYLRNGDYYATEKIVLVK